MSGYLPIPRDFFTQFLWDEKRSFSKAEAYLDLLQFAAFAPSERFVSGKLIDLDEGECIASVRFLAVRWGWGKDKAAQFLNLLDTRRITRRETRQGETIVILCRYRDWRDQTDVRPDSKPDTDPDTDQTPTRTNNNKIKKMEKEKKNPPNPQGGMEGRTIESEMLPANARRMNHTDQKRIRANGNTPTMARINGWFRRLPDTLWTVAELIAYIAINPSPAEINGMEAFYTADETQEDPLYRRRDLLTMLNNWQGELDKARAFHSKKQKQ